MALTKEEIKRKMTELFHEVEDITKVDGVDNLPGCEGMLIYEEPLIGFASADDPLFEEYKKPHVIGENYLSPREWMEDTETIISFFLPFREEIRKSNRDNKIMSSKEWLHARFEGQNLLNIYSVRIRQWLEEQGVHVCIPAIDERFAQKITPFVEGEPSRMGLHIASDWSERHAAYAAGLGTFGLTRALITEKGIAGRFGSLLISLKLEPDERPYTGLQDYCIRCGACIRRCPVHAISMERGKDQFLCALRVVPSKKITKPRYGCGKCQVGVPCEFRNPSGGKKASAAN